MLPNLDRQLPGLGTFLPVFRGWRRIIIGAGWASQEGPPDESPKSLNEPPLSTPAPAGPVTSSLADNARRNGLARLGLLVLLAYLGSPLVWQAWLAGRTGWGDPLLLFNAGATLMWMVLAHLGCRRPFWLHLALLPLYLTTAVDLFLLGTFGARLSSGYVSIALTDYADAGEFLSAYARPVSASVLAFLACYSVGMFLIRRWRTARSPAVAVLLGLALAGLYGSGIALGMRAGSSTIRQAFLDMAGHEHSAPMGAVFQSALALDVSVTNAELHARRTGYSFRAIRPPNLNDEVIVWVVGESSRPMNWSLFGYARDTNPELRRLKGVIAFPNMLTTGPHTSVAVPSMLSLRPITDWKSVLARPSIVKVFGEVGFKTYWLSAQAADSWAGVIPQMAAEAARRRYFDQGHDGALLLELQTILDTEPMGSKLFIVLHTTGSHFEYARRYPPEFARFNGSGGTRRDRIVDSYDNSVLYSDWFLSRVIDMLSRRNTHAALLYASDHGENLLDDDRQLLGHALGTRYDLHTSAFMWFSQAMSRDHPQQLANAQRNAASALSLSDLPHSLLDFAGVQASELDLRRSVFNDTFVEHPRSYIVRGDMRREFLDAAPDASGRLLAGERPPPP